MNTLRKFVDRVVYEPNFFMKVRIAGYIFLNLCHCASGPKSNKRRR